MADEKKAPQRERRRSITHRALMRVNTLFKDMDKSKTGYLDHDEVNELIRRYYLPTYDEVDEMSKYLDIDEDGEITCDEYIARMKMIPGTEEEFELTSAHIELIRSNFVKLDKDKSGKLEHREVRDLIRETYVAPKKVFDKFMEVLDVDKNGKVTFKELANAFGVLEYEAHRWVEEDKRSRMKTEE